MSQFGLNVVLYLKSDTSYIVIDAFAPEYIQYFPKVSIMYDIVYIQDKTHWYPGSLVACIWNIIG